MQDDGAVVGRRRKSSRLWLRGRVSSSMAKRVQDGRDAVRFLSAALLISAPAALVAMSADGATQSVNPGSAWCGVVNAAAPGDTIVFAAGIYTGTCSITASGSLAAPITLRSQTASAADRAVLAYPGTSSNIIDVYGSYLVFRWLTFGPTAPGAGVNPLKLRSSVQGIVVDQNVFQGTDIAVAANSSGSTYRSISITNNVLTNMQSTGLYFGCHDGTSCHALDILIQGNLIDTVQPGDGVGYGLEIKLNSWATILENTVYDPQGPGIEVYGSNRGDPPSVVERNYVEGSRNDAGINVGGGPAIVRNNIVVGNAYNGIWAQDYAGRGLQQNVWIVENTALANQTGGIKVSNWQAGAGNILAFNAVAPLLGTPALTPASPIADTLLGNVACVPAASCFVQPVSAPYDLWPLSGGPLIGAAASGMEPWRVGNDFMCAPRGIAADTGAMQRTSAGNGPPLGGGSARPACGSGGTLLHTLTPCRAVDTRNAPGAWGGPALLAGTERSFVLASRCGIPPTARAVTANVTVATPTAAGVLSLRPGGTAPLLASTINYATGQTRANNAVLLLGAGGDVVVACGQASGTTQFILDVTGYFQ